MTSHLTAANLRDRGAEQAAVEPEATGWRRESIRLFRGLVDYRLTLRTAARRAGDQAMAQRLRRMARRGRATTKMLKQMEPSLHPDKLDLDLDPLSGDPLWLAGSGEIGAIAACLRRNRRVRASAGNIASGGAPGPLRRFADRVSDRIEREAWELNTVLQSLLISPTSRTSGGRPR